MLFAKYFLYDGPPGLAAEAVLARVVPQLEKVPVAS